MKSLNPTLEQMCKRELQIMFNRRKQEEKDMCITGWCLKHRDRVNHVRSKYKSKSAYYKSVSVGRKLGSKV